MEDTRVADEVSQGDKAPRSPAIAKAGAILEALAREGGGPLGISEIGRRIGVAKSSVAAICDTLVDVELLNRSDRGFQLGPKLAEYGAVFLGAVDLVEIFNGAAWRAVDALGETVQLAVLRNELEVVYVSRAYGNHPIHVASEVGQALPANCTAAGKALLASLHPDQLARRLEGIDRLRALTDRSITDPAELAAGVTRIREVGYATDDEETVAGVYCVALASGAVQPSNRTFAVSCTFLKARSHTTDVDEIVQTLTGLSDRILSGLGLPHTAPVRSGQLSSGQHSSGVAGSSQDPPTD